MIDTEKLDKLQKYSRAIAALSLALFLALIVISLWSLWRVREEVAGLEKRKQELTLDLQRLETETERLETETEKLKTQYDLTSKTLEKIAEQRPESVTEAIHRTIAEQPDKPATGQDTKRNEYTKQAIEQLIQAAPSAARNMTRIYLHIGDESQRQRARRIAGELKQAGYLVPGIENVGERRRPRSTEVRYYARTDAEKDEAQKIIALLQGWGIKAKTERIDVASKPWQYEIWFGSDFN
jgi:cell division protein FtsB